MRFDVGLIAGLPQGDYDNVDTSPGILLAFGITVAPNISVFGGLRYFSIQVEGDQGDTEFSNYDFIAGGRYAFPVSPTAKVFGEGMLLYSTLAIDTGGESDSESGIGFGVRGGGVFNVSGNIGIGGAISFSTATIDVPGFGDFESAWVGLEGFASFGF